MGARVCAPPGVDRAYRDGRALGADWGGFSEADSSERADGISRSFRDKRLRPQELFCQSSRGQYRLQSDFVRRAFNFGIVD